MFLDPRDGIEAGDAGARVDPRDGSQLQSGLVNGAAGAVVTLRGRPFAVMAFTVIGGRITEINVVADPECLRRQFPRAKSSTPGKSVAGAGSNVDDGRMTSASSDDVTVDP